MYAYLAACYDSFMKDRTSWYNYLLRFLPKSGRCVDFGCGTGTFTISMFKDGYDVIGVDISDEMLSKACENARKSSVADLKFVKGDVSAFKFLKECDFVTAICDTFNYVQNPLKAFKGIYNGLKSGGVFLFDISSEHKLKSVLGNNAFTDSSSDWTYFWQNNLDEKKNCINMQLTFFNRKDNSSDYSRTHEEQTQYIHSCDSLCGLLKDVGFTDIECFEHLTVKKPSENTERIQFIAHKK